jgi:ribosomal protein L35AE/L33A
MMFMICRIEIHILHVHLERPGASIPIDLLQHSTVLNQLLVNPTTVSSTRDSSRSVVDRAAQYRQTASSVRIGNIVRTGGNSGVNRNLERARTAAENITRERQEKKEQRAREVAGWVKIHVHLYKWAFDGSQTQRVRMTKVSYCYIILHILTNNSL